MSKKHNVQSIQKLSIIMVIMHNNARGHKNYFIRPSAKLPAVILVGLILANFLKSVVFKKFDKNLRFKTKIFKLYFLCYIVRLIFWVNNGRILKRKTVAINLIHNNC